MDNIFYEGQVMWSHIDANMHVRHSAYSDFAAQARLNMLSALGIKPAELLKLNIGPILFREELIYLREIEPDETVRVTSEITKSRADGTRWSIRHEIYRSDDIKAAIINVDGAWIDVGVRKLTALPADMAGVFATAPKSADYVQEIPAPKP
jgi:acyl-CoA thioester hydrolase